MNETLNNDVITNTMYIVMFNYANFLDWCTCKFNVSVRRYERRKGHCVIGVRFLTKYLFKKKIKKFKKTDSL